MRFILYIICFFHLWALQAQTDVEHIKKEIEKIIAYDTSIDYKGTPAFTVAILDGDSTFVIDFGEYENEEINNRERIFEIGSLSKPITASLVSVLESENILRLEDPVSLHLPKDYLNPRVEYTIGELVTHSSGLPKLPKYFGSRQKDSQDPYAYYTKQDLLEFYSAFIPSKEKGKFLYSHVNYALLELVIESATGLSYEEALDKYLLTPLDMSNTYLEVSTENKELVAEGFDRAGRRSKMRSYSSFAAAEGLKASLDDLISYARANIGNSNTAIDQLLEQNHNPILATNLNDHIYSGNGWHIFNQKKNFDIITHAGKSSGHRCNISFIKETKTGVIIVSNSAIGTQDLNLLVLRMINDNWKRKT